MQSRLVRALNSVYVSFFAPYAVARLVGNVRADLVNSAPIFISDLAQHGSQHQHVITDGCVYHGMPRRSQQEAVEDPPVAIPLPGVSWVSAGCVGSPQPQPSPMPLPVSGEVGRARRRRWCNEPASSCALRASADKEEGLG